MNLTCPHFCSFYSQTYVGPFLHSFFSYISPFISSWNNSIVLIIVALQSYLCHLQGNLSLPLFLINFFFDYSCTFSFLINFTAVLPSSIKDSIGILIEIVLLLQIKLECLDIFTSLHLLTQDIECLYLFIYFSNNQDFSLVSYIDFLDASLFIFFLDILKCSF